MTKPRDATGLPDISSQHWREQAACATREPTWWDADSDTEAATTEYASSICWRVCTVQEACLTDALETGVEHTVRGGFTPNERTALKDGAACRRALPQPS